MILAKFLKNYGVVEKNILTDDCTKKLKYVCEFYTLWSALSHSAVSIMKLNKAGIFTRFNFTENKITDILSYLITCSLQKQNYFCFNSF